MEFEEEEGFLQRIRGILGNREIGWNMLQLRKLETNGFANDTLFFFLFSRVCTHRAGLIRKYGLNVCRQVSRSRTRDSLSKYTR